MTRSSRESLDIMSNEGGAALGFARGMRRVPDWILHPWRRRAALAALAGRPRPATLLVVCHGNICRSPFAAAVLAAALPDVRVTSGGFIGPGREAPPEAVEAGTRYNVDLSSHRSRVLTGETVRAAAIIVTMDVGQRREVRERFGRSERDLFVLGDFDPESGNARTIYDPVSQPLAVFEQVYARIVRCTRQLEQAIVRRD